MDIQGQLDSISIYNDLLLVLSDLLMCFALRIVTNNNSPIVANHSQILLKEEISTDWTNSSKASILSTISSTEVFSSSQEKPIRSLKIPKATGSFLYSVFQKRPS